MFYMACESCKKKVMPCDGGYACESCMRNYENAVPTYNFSVKVSDCSGTLMLGVFGEIGESVLGMTAREFLAIHEDTHQVKDLTMNRLHQEPVTMVVRAKVDQQGYSEDGPSIRYTAIRVADFNYKNANENLLKHLAVYKSQSMEESTF